MTDPVPLIGEPLAVDLVNTRPRLASGPVDLIGDVAGLRAWLALEAERFEEAVGPLGGDDLAELHRVREHIADALYAARDGEPVPPEAVLGINRALAAAPLVRELVREGGEGLVLVPRREGAPAYGSPRSSPRTPRRCWPGRPGVGCGPVEPRTA
ncbi:ABATE domain-containing protein [Streptomyces sp. MT29]|nr:ABATE domain-containing protein [Streptomyces sp. MT29]